MPYKDEDTEREASKERMRKYRAKGVTEGVTSEGVTDWGRPTVLSDGQLWWPGHQGLHPPGCECGAKHIEKPAC